MSLKLTFTKVSILSFSRKPESGCIKLSCAPSVAIAKALSWGETDAKGNFTPADFPQWQKSATPTGQLAASICEFTPKHADQAKHAIELKTSSVRGFELIRTQIKNGKTAKKSPAFKTELHFAIDFTDESGARMLEAYIQIVPESTLKVSYERQAEQQELDGVEQTEERGKATAAEAD